ncbi:rhodanese-like domain-containing protein [soil metagenome]
MRAVLSIPIITMASNEDYKRLTTAALERIEEVSAEEAGRRVAAGAVLLDIRDPDEVAQSPSVDGSVHISRGRLESRIADAVPDKRTPVMLYCAGGGRGRLATDTLRQLGYENAANIEGGLRGWREAFDNG